MGNDEKKISADFNPHFRKGSDSVGRRVELLQAYFNPHFRKGSDDLVI